MECFFNGVSTEKIPPSSETRNPQPFSGKSILVLNGGGEMGKEIASAFLERGAMVTIYSSASSVGSGKSNDRGSGGLSAVFSEEHDGPLTGDLLEKILDDADPMDGVTHCLGSDDNHPATGREIPAGSTRNLLNAQRLASTMMRRMCNKSSGKIIFISPNYWEKLKNPTEYEVVRGAVAALAGGLEKQAADHRVSVNCLVSGFIGDMEAAGIRGTEKEKILEAVPMKARGDLNDLVDAVLFLAADASRYITGQVISIDGGFNI